MDKSPIEIAVGQTNILIEDEVCKAVGKVGIHINKEELLKALKAYEFVEELTNYIFTYPDDDYMTMECLCRKLVKHGLIDKVDGYYEPKAEEWNEPNCSEKPNNCEDEQTDTEIARAIVHKMIDDAVIAEDAYPNLRQKMHDAVDEYEPQKWETPPKFEHKGIITTCVSVPVCLLGVEDEPQTEKPKIRKRNDKPFRAVWLDDDHNEIGTPQTDCSWK